MNLTKASNWLSVLTKELRNNVLIAFDQDFIMRPATMAGGTHKVAQSQLCANPSVVVTRATGKGEVIAFLHSLRTVGNKLIALRGTGIAAKVV